MIAENGSIEGVDAATPISFKVSNAPVYTLLTLSQSDLVSPGEAGDGGARVDGGGEPDAYDAITAKVRSLSGSSQGLPVPGNDMLMYKRGDVYLTFPKRLEKTIMSATTGTVVDLLMIMALRQLPERKNGKALGEMPLDQVLERCTCFISLDEYCLLHDAKDRKEARRAIGQSIDALNEVSIHYKSAIKVRGKTQEYTLSTRFLDTTASPLAGERRWVDGRLMVGFSPRFMDYLINHHGGYLMPIHLPILATKRRSVQRLYHSLMAHFWMNSQKQGRNCMKVGNLLGKCDYDLKARHRTQQIIEPFERDLDTLMQIGVLEKWEYCHAGGKRLARDELDPITGVYARFNDYCDLLIKFRLSEVETKYPIKPRKPGARKPRARKAAALPDAPMNTGGKN